MAFVLSSYIDKNKLMIDVLISNYTTLRNAHIPINGLVVLRANSNGGKSSAVNAIFAGVTAEFPPGALRWGESEAVIELRFQEGVVRLTRTGGSSKYTLLTNGQQLSYSKFGRKLPDEVVSFLNLCIIQSGDSTMHLNFHQQFAQPLSLAMSHSRFVSLLSSSDLLEEHKELSKKLSKRAYELQGSIDSFSSLVSTTQASLDVKGAIFNSMLPVKAALDAKYLEVDRLLSSLSAITSLAESIRTLRNLKNTLNDKLAQADRLHILLSSKLVKDELFLKVSSVYNALKTKVSMEQSKKVLTEAFQPLVLMADKLSFLHLQALSLEATLASLVNASKASSTISSDLLLLEKSKVKADFIFKVVGAKEEHQELLIKARTLSNLKTSLSNLHSLTRDRDNKKIIIDRDLCPLCMSPLGSHKH